MSAIADDPKNPCGAMTVGEYADWLLANFDRELPLHSFAGMGNFPPMLANHRVHKAREMELMVFRDPDEAFVGDAADETWTLQKDRFHEPFKAVVIG